MLPKDQWGHYTITKVVPKGDYSEVTFDNGSSFNISGDPPLVGGNISLCPSGSLGSTIRGVAINGVVRYYRTVEEQEELDREWRREYELKKQKDFERNKPELDKRFAALPDVFQKRIQRRRDNNLDFRRDFEPYELFTCEQAVVLAEALGSIAAIDRWGDLPWELRTKMVPDFSDDHSENTFGCAVILAKVYLTTPENVPDIMGAMAPLVGSKDYGDIPK